MQRVDRPPIKPNIWSIAVQLHKAFAGIVTRLTRALQLAEEELVWIAAMGFNMIRDRRRNDLAATLQAEFAERVLAELMLTEPLPVR
jgi:hypothetical protein